MKRHYLAVLSGVAVLGTIAWLFIRQLDSNIAELPSSSVSTVVSEPTLKITEVASGLNHPWDIVFPTQDIAFYSLRSGEIHSRMLITGEDWTLVRPDNLIAEGEGGLLGLALDANFTDNKYIYACYNARINNVPEVRVTRYEISKDLKSIITSFDTITGIQSKAGRHSGCRLAMDKTGHLWVATGDSAIGSAPQDPGSLAGKVLRVNRDGRSVSGNQTAPYDTRIFSYGHRNIQGLVVYEKPLQNGAYGYTVEHGPDVDDELNFLLPGNFGWDPNKNGFYDESVDMTDLNKFPNAAVAIWSTGEPTLALSGAEVLTFNRWQAWRGRLMIAALKAQEVRLVELSENGEYESDQALFKNEYGRIRTIAEGPDGNVYLLTDNGNDRDKILKIQAVCTVCE